MQVFKLILVVLLFSLSALISGSEVAYFNRRSPSELAYTKAFGLLATILVLNNLVNAYLSAIISNLFPASDLLAALLLSVAIALFSEIIPKRLALTHPGVFVRFTEFVYRPLSDLFSLVRIRLEADVAKISVYTVMEAIVDTLRNSELTEDEKLLWAKILYAIHGKGYAVMYPLSNVPILRFEMSAGEAKRLLRDMGYDRDWVPVLYLSHENPFGMVRLMDVMEAPDELPLMDLRVHPAIYFPVIGSFAKLLNTLEEKGYTVLVDEFGSPIGFSYRKDVEIWLLSFGNVVPLRTSLLEIYLMSGRELGPIHWDVAELFFRQNGKKAKKGDSIVLQGVRLEVVDDFHVKVEVLD